MVQTQEQKNEPNVWKPNAGMQELFLSCPADEVFYGGAAGGGKTDALLVDSLRGIGQGGYKALLLRKTFPELEKSLILRSHEIIPAFTNNRARYDSINHRWLFSNQDILQFGHCKTQQDVQKYQSAEYHYIGFDELTHFDENTYLFLFSRLRSRRRDIQCFIRAASNPGGIGHNWVKKRFIDALDPCELGYFKRIEGEDIRTHGRDLKAISRCWIPAGIKDNPKLDPSYERSLHQLPETLKRAFLYGDWSVLTGQYFKEFDHKLHVVAPFEVPKHWNKYISFDWGYNDPSCALWFAVSPSGHHFCYREYYDRLVLAKDVARIIRKMSGDDSIISTFADPSCWNKHPNGRSVYHDFSDERIYLTKANNDRIQGWQKVRQMLALMGNNKPKCMIFNTCENLIRTLPALQYAEGMGVRKEDASQKQEDHAPDAFRYYAISSLVDEDVLPEKPPPNQDEYVHRLTLPVSDNSLMEWNEETGYLD